jgi:hypothetical protein
MAAPAVRWRSTGTLAFDVAYRHGRTLSQADAIEPSPLATAPAEGGKPSTRPS